MRQAQLVSAASVLLRPALLTTALESSLERDDRSRATHRTCAIPADSRQATPFALMKRYQSVSGLQEKKLFLEHSFLGIRGVRGYGATRRGVTRVRGHPERRDTVRGGDSCKDRQAWGNAPDGSAADGWQPPQVPHGYDIEMAQGRADRLGSEGTPHADHGVCRGPSAALERTNQPGRAGQTSSRGQRTGPGPSVRPRPCHRGRRPGHIGINRLFSSSLCGHPLRRAGPPCRASSRNPPT